MKKTIAMLLGITLLLIMTACSSKQPAEQETDQQAHVLMTTVTQDSTTAETEVPTDSITSEKEETTSELLTESDENTNSEAEQTGQPETGTTSQQTESIKPSAVSEHISEPAETTSESVAGKPETSSESTTELPEQSKEEEPMKEVQFYITANSTTFTANFADNDSADAFCDLLREGDLTIHMSDYGSFEKVGSIGTSLPRKDTQISTTTGDVVLYQGNQIVIFYGTNAWSYSRLGKIVNADAEELLSAFGKGDVDITFSLTEP